MRKKGDFEALQDISATAVGDLVACIESFNEINGTEFDGIILPTETVVFDSRQIKSATDNIGTFDRNNPDIKYSFAGARSQTADHSMLAKARQMEPASVDKIFETESEQEGNHDISRSDGIHSQTGKGADESVSENAGDVKPDTHFSLKAPVEETKQLVAVHNFTTADLRNAARLGGLSMPSIAILKSSQPHTRYGEISLVFRRSTIDPAADSRNAVYSGDAYTPTFPQTSFKISREVEERLSDLYYGLLAAQKTRRTTNAARR